MKARITVLAGVLCLLLLAACAESEWTPPEMPHEPSHVRIKPGYSHPIEMHFSHSDIIARVRLVEVEERVHTMTAQEHAKWNPDYRAIEPTGDTVYAPAFHFKFEVLEYFRGGNGASLIWGYSILQRADSNSEADARAAIAYFRERRDMRWDNKEAIVFMNDDAQHIGVSLNAPAENYFLGVMHGTTESYSLNQWGGWFPLASSGGGASGAVETPRFIIRDPEQAGASGASEDTPDAWNAPVGLEKIRRYATMTQKQISLEGHAPMWAAYRARLADIDLTAEQSDAGVTLQWEKKQDIFTSLVEYEILRQKEGEESFTQVSVIPPEARGSGTTIARRYEYTDASVLSPDTTYTYAVRVSVDFDDDDYDVALIAESVEVVTDAAPEPEGTPESAGAAAESESTLEPEATPEIIAETPEPVETPEPEGTPEPESTSG